MFETPNEQLVIPISYLKDPNPHEIIASTKIDEYCVDIASSKNKEAEKIEEEKSRKNIDDLLFQDLEDIDVWESNE